MVGDSTWGYLGGFGPTKHAPRPTWGVVTVGDCAAQCSECCLPGFWILGLRLRANCAPSKQLIVGSCSCGRGRAGQGITKKSFVTAQGTEYLGTVRNYHVWHLLLLYTGTAEVESLSCSRLPPVCCSLLASCQRGAGRTGSQPMRASRLPPSTKQSKPPIKINQPRVEATLLATSVPSCDVKRSIRMLPLPTDPMPRIGHMQL